MKFELRKIEYSARLSEETHCYSAQLWIDGKHAFDVSNHGHGAADDVGQVGDLTEKEVNADIAHTRGKHPSAETKLDQGVLKDALISGMQKHADIDRPEEVNEMAELEQELAAALAQGGAEAAQPKALPMAEEDDVTE